MPESSVRDALMRARQRLDAAGIDTAALDARVLLGHVLEQPQTWLYANSDATIPEEALTHFEARLARRCQREPVSHIVGMREFWSRSFEVGAEVLTPRPDSETLIAAVLEHVRDRKRPLRILDLGTGSGCLLLTLLCEYPDACGVGVDLSQDALRVAARNGRTLELDQRVDWVAGEWETALDAKFDVVVSNPPYIETDAMAELEPEVVAFEPHLALDGGADGLDAYRRILARLDSVLAEDGLLFFEIGQGQSDDITRIADAEGYRRRAVCDDLSGTARALIFYRAAAR